MPQLMILRPHEENTQVDTPSIAKPHSYTPHPAANIHTTGGLMASAAHEKEVSLGGVGGGSAAMGAVAVSGVYGEEAASSMVAGAGGVMPAKEAILSRVIALEQSAQGAEVRKFCLK